MKLTVRDAAGLLGVSEKTIYRWLKQNAIPAYRINEQYRFNRAELLEWATAHKIAISPKVFEETEGSSLPVPSLSQSLKEGGVYYRVEGSNKSEVLRSVVETMRLPEGVDKEYLYSVLMAREGLGSTAIGDGVAIPHARSPIVHPVAHPMVSLCFLEKPVEYGALDGKLVYALFVVVSPTVRAHLHVLARLSYCLRDAEFQAILQRKGLRDELSEAIRKVESALDSSPTGSSS
jgi:PTS system nitrogen regulatory IIA component